MISEYQRVLVKATGEKGVVVDICESQGETVFTVEKEESENGYYPRSFFHEYELTVIPSG